jgi:hypothetical protein
MGKIFISHSQADTEMRDYFLKICGLAGVEGKAIEFERFSPPPWRFIKNEMTSSDALFLLIGPNVIDRGVFTQNWISFEIGLACQLGKQVWVFEQRGAPVHFPVPYLNHYMLYDPASRDNLDYIREIIEAYKIRTVRGSFPMPYAQVDCPNAACGISFDLHTAIEEFYCPACRQPIKFV